MSNNQFAIEVAKLNVIDVVDHPLVRQQFALIYSSLWGKNAEEVCEREAHFFKRLLNDTPALQQCTPVSAFIAFIDLAVSGLSLEPGIRALCYLQPRNVKMGKDAQGKDIYESRINLTISGYGDLAMRTRSGQIKHADNPVVVYEGDDFKFSDTDGRKSVSYSLNINHNSGHPIACFMRITRADNSIDYGVLLESDWDRLAWYSSRSNRKWDAGTRTYVSKPNELYNAGRGGSIDIGFLVAKCIKHAFKTYPKLKIGRGTSFEADQPAPPEEDFYSGIADKEGNSPEHLQESFAPAPDHSAGITVDTEENDDDAW